MRDVVGGVVMRDVVGVVVMWSCVVLLWCCGMLRMQYRGRNLFVSNIPSNRKSKPSFGRYSSELPLDGKMIRIAAMASDKIVCGVGEECPIEHNPVHVASLAFLFQEFQFSVLALRRKFVGCTYWCGWG